MTALRYLAPLCLLLLFSPATMAQEDKADDTSMREIVQQSEVADAILQDRENRDPDALAAGTTPLSTVLGIRDAGLAKDYTRASRYLDMRYLPEDLNEYTPEALFRGLAYVWAQQNIVDISGLSDEPEGNLSDGLPAFRDLLGYVTISSGEVPIYLQRVPDGKGGKVWKISNATVARIPEMWEELGYSPVAIYLSNVLPDVSVMGMQNWQLLATALAFLLAWPIAIVITNLLTRLALMIPNGFPNGIRQFFRRPFRVFTFLMLAREIIEHLGLSLTARIYLQSSGVDYIAITILIMGCMSLFRDYQIRKMQRAGNAQYAALLRPITTMGKVLVITAIALVWADSAGYNMSTIIAGLGVGSLAVALAAQKTLENLIGAITLYSARPVSAGDLCRFGNTLGVVEEIGLRSTTLRTLNRTVVAIPNSVFSSAEIENFSRRDRMRFFREMRIEQGSADQLRFLLLQLRELFYSHSDILQETVSVRLERFMEDTAIIRIDSAVPTQDYQYFLAVAEDLNLRMLELIEAAGLELAGPGQTVMIRKAAEAGADKLDAVQQTLEQWRTQDALPFPNFDEAQLAAMRDSITLPQGSRSKPEPKHNDD